MKEKTTGAYVATVVANIIVLVVVNTVPAWRHLTQGIVLASWSNVLWAMNTTLVVSILGNLLLAYYHPVRLQSFFGLLLDIAGFVSILVFYRVFPLDFSRLVGEWLNTLLKVLLIVGMCGTLVALIVHLVGLLPGRGHPVSPELKNGVGDKV